MSKTALITGITGQDGSLMARLLLDKGYRVVGGMRRTSGAQGARLDELGIADAVERTSLDILEMSNLLRVLDEVRPDEIYNFGGQSFVTESFRQPIYTAEVTGLGVARLLEAVRTACPSARFFQASSSEMFGNAQASPQNEQTPFHPRSPYAIAKLMGHWMTVNYRESFGLHACSGIMFNHESPLRGQEFVTRRITLSLARVKHGLLPVLELGNLGAMRDWGYAGDYVEGVWAMTQHPTPGDFVLATGENHSVRDFLIKAAAVLGMDLAFEGEGLGERGIDRVSGREVIRVNPALFRPAEVDVLLGSAAKAEREFGWKRKVGFAGLVEMMAQADERRVRDNRVMF
jgi:GDPmannose 4,6-dehydratase